MALLPLFDLMFCSIVVFRVSGWLRFDFEYGLLFFEIGFKNPFERKSERLSDFLRRATPPRAHASKREICMLVWELSSLFCVRGIKACLIQ